MIPHLHITNQCSRVNLAANENGQPAYLLTKVFPTTPLSDSWLPLNVALVVHTNPTIGDELFSAVKSAIKGFIDLLRPSDFLSLITNSQQEQIICPAQAVKNPSRFYPQVEQIANQDGKLLSAGLRQGLQQVLQGHTADSIDRILLVIDGVVESEEIQSCLELVDQAGKHGIPIQIIGVGSEWQEDVFIELLQKSWHNAPNSVAANMEYILGAQNAINCFQRAHQAMRIVLRNVEVTYQWMRGVEIPHAWQVHPAIGEIPVERNACKGLKIGCGDLLESGVAYLLEMNLPSRGAGDVRIAQVRVDCGETGLGTCDEVVLNYSSTQAITNQLNSDVMDYVEMVQAYHLQHQALNDIEIGDIQRASQKLRQVVAILLSQGENQLAEWIRREVDFNLQRYKQISNQGRKAIRFYSRQIRQPLVQGNSSTIPRS